MLAYSQKEILNLPDILNSHASAIECLSADLQEVQDPQLRQILQNHERVYRQHYDVLVQAARQQGIDGHHATGYTPSAIAGQQQFVGAGAIQPMQPGALGRRKSDRAIAICCLDLCKMGALNLTWAAIESATPSLRRLLLDMARDHAEMAFELFAFLHQRNWYPVPAGNPQMAQQIGQAFQPAAAAPMATASQATAPMAQAGFPAPSGIR